MKYTLIYIVFILSSIVCSCSSTVEEKILLEKPTNLIVNSADKSPYSGIVNIIGDDNITFIGEARNGKKHNQCTWIRENGDTIQLEVYRNGDMIYSNQFDFKGNRSIEWIRDQATVTSNDSLLIQDVFQIIENSNFELLESMVQQNQLPYTELVKNKILELEKEHGKLRKLELLGINKSLYNHRPEKYLELDAKAEFELNNLTIGIRLLELENKLQTVELWKKNDNHNVSKSYDELNVWTYLNI